MLPTSEVVRLLDAIRTADDYARSGRLDTGYVVLRSGIALLQGSADPWAEELLQLWQRSLAEFRERYPNTPEHPALQAEVR